jgi:hypothetical protein
MLQLLLAHLPGAMLWCLTRLTAAATLMRPYPQVGSCQIITAT